MVVAVGSILAAAALVQPPAMKPVLPITAKAAVAFGDPLGLHAAESPRWQPSATSAAIGAAALVAATQPEAALAKGGAYGIWEGRIVSMAHPFVMAVLYTASAFAAFTGWQWRRLREIGGEITELKAELKGPKAAIAAAEEKGETPSASLVSEAASLESKINELSATRKELADGSFRDKHYQVGAVILGLGTSFAIEGPVNTFLRAQKLFPGPHLYAGAGVVVCWAMAASLVPMMGKGKESARIGHMAFNALALGLFTWQLPTGWDITQKVIKFTKFP